MDIKNTEISTFGFNYLYQEINDKFDIQLY